MSSSRPSGSDRHNSHRRQHRTTSERPNVSQGSQQQLSGSQTTPQQSSTRYPLSRANLTTHDANANVTSSEVEEGDSSEEWNSDHDPEQVKKDLCKQTGWTPEQYDAFHRDTYKKVTEKFLLQQYGGVQVAGADSSATGGGGGSSSAQQSAAGTSSPSATGTHKGNKGTSKQTR